MEPADCDFDDFVYTPEEETECSDIKECTTEKIDKIKNSYIIQPPDCKMSCIFHKKIYDGAKGTKCINPRKYYERNIIKEKEKEKEKGKIKEKITEKITEKDKKLGTHISKYENPLFNEWQNRLVDSIHANNNCILQVATSCGKTWATNAIISYYILSGSSTALFVVPNYEILRDNVSEILEKNYKVYIYPGYKCIDTQTIRYSTYDESKKSLAQILCITADNFISFITNDINYDFIKRLKYIVFDEVHLPEIYSTIKWAILLPHDARYILLSATISDQNIEEFKRVLSYEGIAIDCITYAIRPIPLQYLLLKKDKTIKRKLSYQVNISDPTDRDISHMMAMKDIRYNFITSREESYQIGQTLLKDDVLMAEVKEQIIYGITNAELEPTAENIYTLLKYLFKKDMQPIIIFGASSHEVTTLCKNLISYITFLEESDEEHIKLCKMQKIYEKLAEQRAISEKKSKSRHDDDVSDEGDDTINFPDLNKWRFPSLVENTYIKSGFIKNCIQFGIGIYTQSMKTRIKSNIFDWFKEGKLKVLFADSSISVGINLPVRTCILTGNDITPTLFKQMGGRAGRRGHDTHGYIIPLIPDTELLIKSMLCNEEGMPGIIKIATDLECIDYIKLHVPSGISNYYEGDKYVHNPAVSLLRSQILEKYMKSNIINDV